VLNDSNITIESNKSDKHSTGMFGSFFQSLIKPVTADEGPNDPGAEISSDEDDSVINSKSKKRGDKGEYH